MALSHLKCLCEALHMYMKGITGACQADTPGVPSLTRESDILYLKPYVGICGTPNPRVTNVANLLASANAVHDTFTVIYVHMCLRTLVAIHNY